MKISKETIKNSWNKVITIFKGVDNLYLKFFSLLLLLL